MTVGVSGVFGSFIVAVTHLSLELRDLSVPSPFCIVIALSVIVALQHCLVACTQWSIHTKDPAGKQQMRDLYF